MNLPAPRHVVFLLLSLAIASCGGGSGGTSAPPPVAVDDYRYVVPVDNGDGWQTSDVASQGMRPAPLVDMVNRILRGTYPGIDSVGIARNNQLVFYWRGERALDQFDAWIDNRDTSRHVLHSTSKSFTSALIGIAIDLGFIASTDVGFYDLFSYPGYDNPDPRKAAMTLEDALTMRLGITWDEWSLPYTNPDNDLVHLENNNLDWARALLDLPMSHDPGTVFAYNTAATIALGQALENATGMPMADFANTYLFHPMQIDDADWWTSPTGLPVGGSGLFLKTRDLLKFGQLFVDGGRWHGRQLISPAWIAASVARHVDVSRWTSFSTHYGYQWWIGEFFYNGAFHETWMTAGYGGQYMFCIPSLDLVAAFTGHNYANGAEVNRLFDIMRDHVLSALN